MAYIGKTPTPVPLTSSDIAADIINNTHIGDTAISGFDALATAPADTDEFLISDGGVLKRLDASLIGGKNAPAFEAKLGSAQSISNDTLTKIQFGTEDFDTDSCYDNSSNYRFTPNVAGKYLIYFNVYITAQANSANRATAGYIYKNGSSLVYNGIEFKDNNGRAYTPAMSKVIDMNGSSDYIEIYGYINNTSGSPEMLGDGFFGAYKLVGV